MMEITDLHVDCAENPSWLDEKALAWDINRPYATSHAES